MKHDKDPKPNPIEAVAEKLEPVPEGYRWKDYRSSGTYAVVHPSSQSVYVGSAAHLGDRLAAHRSSLKGGYHIVKGLQRVFDEEPKVEFFALKTDSKEEAVKLEQELISSLMGTEGFLNGSPNAVVPRKGMRDSEDVRVKNSSRNREAFQTTEARIAHSERIMAAKTGNPEGAAERIRAREEMAARRTERVSAEGYSANRKSAVAVVVDGVVYPSVVQAAVALGITPSGANNHLKRSLEGKSSRIRYADDQRYLKSK